MAGGLFGKPLVLNEKCIFFSLIIIGLFFYKPEIKNKKLQSYLNKGYTQV